MPKLSTKTIITGLGVILLLIAGTLTMILMPSEQPQQRKIQTAAVTSTRSDQNRQSQNDTVQTQAEPAKIWYVYVTGAVKSPGVYKLSEDARIFQAVEAAGGFTSRADETSLNLAEPLADGVHVHVATKGERRAATPPSQPARIPGVPSQTLHVVAAPSKQPQQVSNLVDINHASEIELQKLNGIGPALSQRIIEYRQTHGAFTKPEDLLRVKGIGPSKLNKMRPQIQIR